MAAATGPASSAGSWPSPPGGQSGCCSLQGRTDSGFRAWGRLHSSPEPSPCFLLPLLLPAFYAFYCPSIPLFLNKYNPATLCPGLLRADVLGSGPAGLLLRSPSRSGWEGTKTTERSGQAGWAPPRRASRAATHLGFSPARAASWHIFPGGGRRLWELGMQGPGPGGACPGPLRAHGPRNTENPAPAALSLPAGSP